MAGRSGKVLRILSVAALVVLVATGCGGAGRQPQADRGLPRALADAWAQRASAVATAAAAGRSCRASQLASSLRDQIIAQEGRVPARLQKPLVQSANALADRITCTVPPQTVTLGGPRKGPERPGHKRHEPPHHKKHDGHEEDRR
ncbi:MAG: hypothetical protein ACJ75L_09850 [Gaiellaceae bacterium]